MNKWNDIVISLLDCRKNNATEAEYQLKIQDQFKFLGWSVYAGCVEAKPSLPVGNAGALIPDIVLKKNGERVLPVEIKKPSNELTRRQELQLFSYMRQLTLRTGLYIGEKLQLYYDAQNDRDSPRPVLTAQFDVDSEAGREFCELLSYEDFSLDKLERVCRRESDKLRFKATLQGQFSDLNGAKGAKLLLDLVRREFGGETEFQDELEAELAKLNLTFEYGARSEPKQKNSKKKQERIVGKQPRYSLNGGIALPKTKFALEALRLYVRKNPNATFDDITRVFPKKAQGGYGVVRKYSDLQELLESGSNTMGRYSSTPEERLTSSDGVVFVVCNQWDYHNLPNLITILKGLKWKVKEVR